jgi:hypothetical protein
MNLKQQIDICSEHYQKWKSTALNSLDRDEAKKAMERAFFWLELQSAFITLHAIELTVGNDKEKKEKILVAKTKLSKKLVEYAKEILNEL